MNDSTPASSRPFRIAAVVTAYYPVSHADVLLTRWLDERPGDAEWGWPGPRSELVSLHVVQFPENDMARATARRHGLPLYASIQEALTLGGSELAVDAVMLIGEHGDYPVNDLGQKLYPRKELFDKIVEVFKACGRCVPVFCDKHFAWDFADACEMVETAQQHGFLLLGGSSLPHTRHHPTQLSLHGQDIREAVGVFYGHPPNGDEAHGIHSVEVVQALIETRRGGESGVRSVTAYHGEEVWRQQDAGRWSAELVAASSALNPNLQPGDMRVNCRAAGSGPGAWVIEHADGLQVTHLNLTGHLTGWSAAVRDSDGAIHATSPVGGGAPTHYAHFATFARVIEDAFLTGRSSYPLERTLLATGLIHTMVRASQQPGQPLATPELALAYQPISARKDLVGSRPGV